MNQTTPTSSNDKAIPAASPADDTHESKMDHIKFRWIPLSLTVGAGVAIAFFHHDTLVVMEILIVFIGAILAIWGESLIDQRKSFARMSRVASKLSLKTGNLKSELSTVIEDRIRNLRHMQVFDTYAELVESTSRMFRDLKKPTKVFVYRGYDISESTVPDYYKETIDAIQAGKILQYTRVMCVCRLANIPNRLERLKQFSQLPSRSKVCAFWIAYRINPNYFSFITFGDDEVILSFPDAGDIHAGTGVKQSSCGVYLRDATITHMLQSMVQHEITRHNKIETRHIMQFTVPDKDDTVEWHKLLNQISDGLEKYSKAEHKDLNLKV